MSFGECGYKSFMKKVKVTDLVSRSWSLLGFSANTLTHAAFGLPNVREGAWLAVIFSGEWSTASQKTLQASRLTVALAARYWNNYQ